MGATGALKLGDSGKLFIIHHSSMTKTADCLLFIINLCKVSGSIIDPPKEHLAITKAESGVQKSACFIKMAWHCTDGLVLSAEEDNFYSIYSKYFSEQQQQKVSSLGYSFKEVAFNMIEYSYGTAVCKVKEATESLERRPLIESLHAHDLVSILTPWGQSSMAIINYRHATH